MENNTQLEYNISGAQQQQQQQRQHSHFDMTM